MNLRLLGTWIMRQTRYLFLLRSDVLKDAAVQFFCEANGGIEWLWAPGEAKRILNPDVSSLVSFNQSMPLSAAES